MIWEHFFHQVQKNELSKYPFFLSLNFILSCGRAHLTSQQCFAFLFSKKCEYCIITLKMKCDTLVIIYWFVVLFPVEKKRKKVWNLRLNENSRLSLWKQHATPACWPSLTLPVATYRSVLSRILPLCFIAFNCRDSQVFLQMVHHVTWNPRTCCIITCLVTLLLGFVENSRKNISKITIGMLFIMKRVTVICTVQHQWHSKIQHLYPSTRG